MFIEIHMIQNFAPSNLNRDDTNNPKDCEFGGVRRARISSQCIKRAIRQEPIFEKKTRVKLGVRTRLLARELCKALIDAEKLKEDAEVVALAFTNAYVGKTDDKDRTSVLIYLSREEIQAMASDLLKHWDAALEVALNPKDKTAKANSPIPQMTKALVKTTKDRTSAPDIAMFGRMLANDPKLNINIDAACQVAHAISTHRVTMEMDFFTAVDDLQTREETGSGHMNVTGFNSACFYRYARIDWRQLRQNLGWRDPIKANRDEQRREIAQGNREAVALARRTIEGFLCASVAAVPTGKQNSFAAQNPPGFLLAVAREDGMSWSLANAFEAPVRTNSRGGLVGPSIQALDAYWGHLSRAYGNSSIQAKSLTLNSTALLENLEDTLVDNLNAWVNATLTSLPRE